MKLSLNIELDTISLSELMRELLETHDADDLAQAIADGVISANDDEALDAWARKRLDMK